MSNNFTFAPGLPGYGTRGTDGSTGASGLGLYFSSYDGLTDRATLQTKIANNQKLYSSLNDSSISGWPDRVYQVGDIFLDKNGSIYEIIVPSTGTYSSASDEGLSTGLFVYVKPGGAFSRYVNDFNTKKVVIDDVYTNNVISDYTTYPTTIYGIPSTQFTKIQYTDYLASGINYNPFILWTAGTDDKSSLALVRNYANNTFRIGNLDSNSKVRSVDIVFDASNVMVSKDTGSEFNKAQNDGTVLTNHEIQANLLFNPVLKLDGNSTIINNFAIKSSGSNDVSIYWNLYDFFGDQDQNIINSITTDLHFYEASTATNGMIFNLNGDSSTLFRPLIFHGIDASSIFMIKSLKSSTKYKGFLEFNNDGWVRRSNIAEVTTGVTTVDASLVVVESSYSISSDSSILHPTVNLSGSGAYWNSYEYSDWLSLSGTTYGGIGQNQTLNVHVAQNTRPTTRNATVYVSGTKTASISITQSGSSPTTASVTFNIDGLFEKFGMKSFSGTVYLKNSATNSTVASKYISTQTSAIYDQQFINIPTGVSYYIGFGSITVYDIAGDPIPNNDVTRQWKVDGGAYTTGSNTAVFALTGSKEYWCYLEGDTIVV